ncbi:MAG: YidC/Oxa1 family membrane protein insertase, partial [Agathobacter sp.]|nr:YidC/Oxa1 family membrane protein insertase [Agathobacter sp.]
MSNILLTASSGQILGPIAKFLGWIMNAIYMFVYNVFGIESVVLSIVIVTFLIYLCMLPLTIKQQKFSKLTQLMQPEIQAIAEKYKGKRDQASIQAMNNEQQLVYEKYGVNPMGTCLPMLIQMPIWLALYRVFYNIPAYITSVKGYFTGLVNEIQNASGYKDSLAQLLKDYNYTTSSGLSANNVKAALDGASGS